jgi:hypothetical protein
MLNGAIMDTMVLFHPLGESIGKANPSLSTITKMLDEAAKKVTSFIQDVYEVFKVKRRM